MATKELTNRIKVHTRNASGKKYSDECVISAHGLRTGVHTTTPAHFNVPAGITVVFYGPDHYALVDPGYKEALYGAVQPYETYGNELPKYKDIHQGNRCPDYWLKKYQGKHMGLGVGWTNAIKEAWRKHKDGSGTTPDTWETYDTILLAMQPDQSKVKEMTDWHLKLNDQGNRVYQHAAKTAAARQALIAAAASKLPPDLQTSVIESLQNVEELQVMTLNPEYGQVRTEMRNYRQALNMFLSDSNAKAEAQRRLDILSQLTGQLPYDCVTIRYRPGKFWSAGMILLSDVIKDLHQNSYKYGVIHCCFCRSSMVDGIKGRGFTPPTDYKRWFPGKKL